MTSIVSHTLVRNGMPFIRPVLLQVLPFVDRSIITISAKSNDGTLNELSRLEREFPGKLDIRTENVLKPGDLTGERQKMLDSSNEDWIFFLDDDDLWPSQSLFEILSLLKEEEEVDAYSFRPFQVINEETYDTSWNNRWFTKLFKNQNGVCYKHPWPRDLIYKDNKMLYWKVNPAVKNVDIPFYHLSYLKYGSFRTEGWAKEYAHVVGKPALFEEPYKSFVKEIFTNVYA